MTTTPTTSNTKEAADPPASQQQQCDEEANNTKEAADPPASQQCSEEANWKLGDAHFSVLLASFTQGQHIDQARTLIELHAQNAYLQGELHGRKFSDLYYLRGLLQGCQLGWLTAVVVFAILGVFGVK